MVRISLEIVGPTAEAVLADPSDQKFDATLELLTNMVSRTAPAVAVGNDDTEGFKKWMEPSTRLTITELGFRGFATASSAVTPRQKRQRAGSSSEASVQRNTEGNQLPSDAREKRFVRPCDNGHGHGNVVRRLALEYEDDDHGGQDTFRDIVAASPEIMASQLFDANQQIASLKAEVETLKSQIANLTTAVATIPNAFKSTQATADEEAARDN